MTDDNSELQLAHPLKTSPDLFIDSDKWWAEEKYDGDRLTVEFTSNGIVCLTRKSEQAKVPWFLANTQWPSILNQTRLDGECLTDKFIVFDILSFNGKGYRTAYYRDRRHLLETIFSRILLRNVELTPVARTRNEKLVLIERVTERAGEGVIFKDADAMYRSGRSWDWVKYKFYSTCEVVIEEMNRDGKAEGVSLRMLYQGEWIDVGGCKIPSRYQDEFQIQAGDVIEVRYLRFSEDRKLVEPVFLRKRKDKQPSDCVFDQ